MKITVILILISILSQFAFANEGIKEIKIPGYRPNNIIQSPIDETIWIIDQNKTSYEYNYKTEKLAKLSNKIGDFAIGLKDLILQDKFDPDLVWIGNFHKGVLCYRKLSKDYTKFSQTEYFNNEAISVIKPLEDKVWIGTSKNLYYFDRDKKQLFKSNFSKHVWIKNIRKENNNLIINNIYEYNLNNNSITKISKINDYEFPKHSEFKEYENIYFFKDYDNMKSIFVGNSIRPYIINHGISYWSMIVDNYRVYYPAKGDLAVLNLKTREQNIIKIGGISKLYNDNKVIWFFDKFGLGRVDKTSHKIEKSNISFPIVRSFLANDEYIWIGTDDRFVQINKSYLESIMKPKEQVERVEQMIDSKRKELKKEKDPIKYAKGFFEMQEVTTSHKILKSLTSRLKYVFRIRDRSEIELFENILAEGTDPQMREAIYYGLICGYSLNGDPKKALDYHKKLRTSNEKSIFLNFVSDSDLVHLKKADHQLDSLNTINIHEAEKFYKLGKLYYEMFMLSWNYGEVGINTEFPFSFYKQILSDYPESEWADNAEYEMLKYHQICSGEGGDTDSNLSYIKKYDDFLKKYPDTDLYLMVHCIKSSLYYSLMKGADKGCMYPEDLGYLNKADSIIQQVPKDFRDYEYIDNLRKGIKESIEKYSWKINMELDFTIFSQGDSIVISFSLENMYNKPQKISLKSEKGIPNFGVYIKDSSKYPNHFTETFPYVENKEIGDIKSYEYTVNVHDKYCEKWDITKKISVNYFNVLMGHYVFSKIGRYEITGYFILNPRMRLLTEPIIIEIK